MKKKSDFFIKFSQNFLLSSYFESMLRIHFIDFTGIFCQVNQWNVVLLKKYKFCNQYEKNKKLRLYTIVELFLMGIKPSAFGWSPMLSHWATETWVVFVCFLGGWGISSLEVGKSGGAYRTFASEWTLWRIKVGRNLLAFQSSNFVHLCGKFMNKFCQSLLIKVSTFSSNSAHDSCDRFCPRRTKYSLSENCLDSFDGPEVIHFRWKPKRMNVLLIQKRENTMRKNVSVNDFYCNLLWQNKFLKHDESKKFYENFMKKSEYFLHFF